MKKFHKRAAVFLTAATLAGLPAGAFFYSSPGSLTVWADNVEVESSEESSPEDVDFSDGSEVEIHADLVEQAQEDAGNDVTETPEVGITFTEPEGWQTDTATVKIQVEDTKNTGAFSIAKVEARLSENGGWSDITGNMEVSISSNCSVYVRVTDQNGNTYEQNRYIECFDKTKPTIIAAAKNGILIVQGVDAESGIAALYVNGNEFTELTNNTLNVRLQKADTSYEYFTLQAKDKAGNMSEIYKVGNPYYENPDAVKENTEVSGTEQNAASLPADGTASKPTSATATVTEHQTTNETATAPTEPENTGNETDTEADTGRVQGESSASGMTTGTVQDKGGKEFYTIKTKSDKVFYLISEEAKTLEEVQNIQASDWTVYEQRFAIDPDKKCIVYVKITDKGGNTAYLSTDGLVFDGSSPVISGVKHNETYGGSVQFTVNDDNLDYVEIDGVLAGRENGGYTVTDVEGAHTITAVDKAGNRTQVSVTIVHATQPTTESTTEASKPTESTTEGTTEAPKPTQKPTEAPTEVTKPTEAPTEAPTQKPETDEKVIYEMRQDADGNWHYYANDTIAADYCGMAVNEYGWWYIKNGDVDFTYTGMACNEYGWWYFNNGQLDTTFYGLANNEYGTWFYTDGQLNFGFTGMIIPDDEWLYVQNGQVLTDYTGMALNEYGWWYFNNGTLDFNYTGMALNEYGWWYFKNGQLDLGFTGIGSNEYGDWFFKDGRIAFEYTGSYNDGGQWYMVNSGFASKI